MSDHAEANRHAWTRCAAEYAAAGEHAWAAEEITWGNFSVPEAGLRLLGPVAGLDVVELGCGTAYFSAWLARRGARPIGVDLTPAQLETARRMQARHGLDFPLVEADAEAVPLPDACADLVVSEYGASLWCDPERWVPEAARLLRPGGRLIFLTSSLLLALCERVEGPATAELARDVDAARRIRWPDDGSVEFHLPHGEWIDLLGRHGLRVERLAELYAPPGAGTRHTHVDGGWARRWPSEEAWVARREPAG